MDSYQLKEYIIENNKVEFILQELNCQSIKYHSSSSSYWTCGNPPPSDNRQAITVYNNEYLGVINYTKDLGTDKSDIFTLIEYINKCNFFEAMLWCCNILELDYYHSPILDLPESIRITKMLMRMKSNEEEEDDTPIRVLDEKILEYYRTYVNDYWYNDNVPYGIQREWELGYDESTNRITIPIRDELGRLLGIKTRLFKDKIEEWEQKFFYIEPCPRNKILYGYHKTAPYIQKSGQCFCFEAEKSIHQLWSYGYKNSISFMGKRVGQEQINKLSRLNCDIILCLDKDVEKKEVEKLANRFIDGISIWTIYDNDGILDDKESPSDSPVKWEYLVKNNIYKIK
jgi:DNA primase